MEYIDNVVKKSNLEHNDSISTYGNWGAQQNPNTFEVFFNFIKEVKPKRILEIGTSIGGLTQFLNYTAKSLEIDCKILSFDINELGWYNDMRADGIDVRIENIFSSNYSKIQNYVIDFIKDDGVTIVLCDGGNKIGEFNILSDFLKPGDFILAHDYAINKEFFEKEIKNKIWNWCEIVETDISDASLRNNLINYNQEIFNKVVWVCKQKQ